MPISRRDLSLLLPAIFAAQGVAQEGRTAVKLTSKVYHGNEIEYNGDEKKKGRRFFVGTNRSGFRLEMHETVLAAGMETHPPHKHVHEEIVIVAEGTIEAHIEGRTAIAETGSVIYFGSNEMHSARNVGKTPSRYLVVELRGNEA